MEKSLKKRDLVKELFLKGKIVKSDLFNLRYMEGIVKRQDVSFVVSSKVAKTAVLRNRIKRRGRAIVRKYAKDLKDRLALVFIAKQGVAKASFRETETSILGIIKQLK